MSSYKTVHDNSCGCDEYRALSRREFVARTTATAVALSVPAWLPRVTYAQTENMDRDILVSIFLRGGADGLTLVPPFGEAAYYSLRPTIAIPRPDSGSATPAVNLDGFFGLPTAMAALLPAFQSGQLLIIHAVGSTDPTRSHFDAQFFMEIGKPGDRNVVTGWLGRHLASKPPMRADAALRGIGFAFGLPQTLVGAPDTLPIPDPSNFGLAGNSSTRAARLAWLGNSYLIERDPLRTAALNTQRTINTLSALNIGGYVPAGGAVYPTSSFGNALRSTAALIRSDMGIEAVQIDLGGWDTHSAQGPLTGGMSQLMQGLALGLAAFHQDMNAANRMSRLTVVVMSEFGRVARENASQGTDHGHGNVMFVMGGAVQGGRVMRNWPGLNAGQLYENQDLAVTIDYRDILAEIVQRRLANPNLSVVFPGFTPFMHGVFV
ncbi:MAG TPA: DUF1501 domain-containing protein [Vicinamibacterales bacterium]|jgi:uncharacterized protein (DUF1501 family)